MQSFGLGAVHLVGTHAAPPVDAEVCLDVSCAYRAHAGAKFLAYECTTMLDIINPLYLVLPNAFWFHPGCCSWVSRIGQQSYPCLRLTNKYQSTTRVLSVTGEAPTAKNEPTE